MHMGLGDYVVVVVDVDEKCFRSVSVAHNGLSRRDGRGDVFIEAEHEVDEEEVKDFLY